MILIAKSKYNTVWPGISPLSSRGALKGKLSPTQILDAITLEFLLQVKHETHFYIGWKSQKRVSFNIASEASYVYILSGQKLIKNAKKWSIFGEFLKT